MGGAYMADNGFDEGAICETRDLSLSVILIDVVL